MTDFLKISAPETREYWEIPILFEDDQLLALAKPSKLFTSPDRYEPDRPSLMTLLHRDIARGANWAKSRGITYLTNAHRLDFETSGVLLLAKTKSALIHLADQFGAAKPLKTYVALMHKSPTQEEFEISAKIAPHPIRLGSMRIDPKDGKRAHTAFKVKERFAGYTLLECKPTTNRPHQIRVHLHSRRQPVVGDSLYGGSPLLLSRLKRHYRLKGGHVEKPLLDHVALHAESVTFKHPVTGAETTITAPWPRDLTVAIKYLRRYAAVRAGDPIGEQHPEVEQDLDQETDSREPEGTDQVSDEPVA